MSKTDEPTIADQIIQLIEHFNLGEWAIGALVLWGMFFLALFGLVLMIFRRVFKGFREHDEWRSQFGSGFRRGR